MIRVAFSNNGFHRGSKDLERYMNNGLEGYIQAAHDLGFKAYQLQTGACGLFKTTESFQEVDITKIRKKLKDFGIEMHLHNHSPNACPNAFRFAEKGEIYHEYGRYLKAAIEFIYSAGGRVVTFHPPFSDNGDSYDETPIDEATRKKAINALSDLMRDIGSFAEKKGVKLGIESAVWSPPNRPWTSIFLSPEDLDRFVKASDLPPSVGILAEISHLHHMGFNIKELLSMWGEKVFEIHISDAVIHEWVNKKKYSDTLVEETHRVIGEGTLDFRSVIQTLKKLGFDGWLSLEIFNKHMKTLEDNVKSKEMLERIIREV